MSAERNDPDTVNRAISAFSDRLRTPLTTIVAQLELLLSDAHGALNPQQRNALVSVQRNSARLLQVIVAAEESLARDLGVDQDHDRRLPHDGP